MNKYIPPPMRGIESLAVAKGVVKKYGAVGVLIGGLAIRLCQVKMRPEHTGKDVDILILDKTSNKFPVQWERGVDWWVSSKRNHRPSNGTHVGLLWQLILREGIKLSSGLYILSPNLIERCCEHELIAGVEMPDERRQLILSIKDQKPLIDITVLDENAVEFIGLERKQPIEVYQGDA